MTDEKVGLVLSGGGMRGAYEVGVLEGIVEVLERGPGDSAPFDIVSGTSVGAINAAWTAAWSHRGDMHIEGLVDHWLDLQLSTHLRFDPAGALGVVGGERIRRLLSPPFGSEGISLLDADPFEELVEEGIPWEQLHANLAEGLVDAVAVAALEVATGRTFVFSELYEGVEVAEIEDPRRHFVRGGLEPDHVLASAAIPLLFPPREIDYELFCDGGLRLNTPIPPAIRTGADRLVVVTVGEGGGYPQPEGAWAKAARRANYPNPVFLLGKALNALLVDPVYKQMQLTGRINRVVEAMEEVLDEQQVAAVQDKIAAERGAPYRRVPILGFSPSESLGELVSEYARAYEANRFSTRMLVGLAGREQGVEHDLLSYIFFDGHFAQRLIELGRRDVRARAEEVVEFFARSG